MRIIFQKKKIIIQIQILLISKINMLIKYSYLKNNDNNNTFLTLLIIEFNIDLIFFCLKIYSKINKGYY